MIAHTEELDFASAPYTPEKIESTEDLVAYSERCYQEGRAALAGMSEAALDDKWTMRSGDVIHSVNTKAEVIRMTLNQEVHNRAFIFVCWGLLYRRVLALQLITRHFNPIQLTSSSSLDLIGERKIHCYSHYETSFFLEDNPVVNQVHLSWICHHFV